jgi:hypothetical protein
MALKGTTTSQETRDKMSAAHKARWADRRSVYLKVCTHIHIGAKRSKTTRERMSAAHKGKVHSPETIEKIRAAVKATLASKASAGS